MSKQNKPSNVESSIQKPFLRKPLLRRGDIEVYSKHISKIFFIWSDNTSIYHHANNFEESSDLLKQRVSSHQKKGPNKTKDQDPNQTPQESTSDIQQWVRIKFNNNSFVAKYRSSVGPTEKHRTFCKQRKIRNN